MKIIGQIPPVLVYLLTSLSMLNENMYSAALPSIARFLNTNTSTIQLSTTIYYFGFALGIFILGRASDVFGRRITILCGIILYGISTLAIYFSNNISLFILFRFLQAFGASVGSVVAQSMIRDSYKGWRLSYIYATAGMITAFMPVTGSFIGGIIVSYFGFEWIFIILFFIAAICFIIYLLFLPETNSNILIYNKNNINNDDSDFENYRFFNAIKIILTDKILLQRSMIVGFMNGCLFSFIMQAPFILQNNWGLTPSEYGSLFIILTFASFTGGMINRFLIKKLIKTYIIQYIGLFVSLFAFTILIIVNLFISIGDHNKWLVGFIIFIPIAVHLIGHSLLIPNILKDSLTQYPKLLGTAGSIFGTLYYFFTSFVTLISANFFAGSIKSYSIMFFIFLMISAILLLNVTNKNFKTIN